MIDFHYETKFNLENAEEVSNWISLCIKNYGFEVGEINYIFCDDEYLHKLNVEFLNHNTLTDIISFDNTLGKLISGDIFISVDRVKENADLFDVSFKEELYRVIIHGVLHFMGFKDKSDSDKRNMRSEENNCLKNIIN